MMTKRKTVALACALVVVGTVAVLVVPYRAWSYKGPGQLRDNGVLSYPRFQLELPTIPLGGKVHRRVTFTGIPSEDMSLMLYVVGSSFDDEKTLHAAQVQITAQLIEEATPATPRRVICTAAGTPSGKYPESQWVVTTSADHAAFWHCQCLRVPMSRERRYTLDLEISPTGSSLPPKVLVPTLEGGGVELP